MLNSLLQMKLKLLQKEQFKKHNNQEATGDLIENKIADKIHQRIIQKQMMTKYLEKDISPELRHKIIDDLRLKKD